MVCWLWAYELDDQRGENLATFNLWQLTPEIKEPTDEECVRAYEQAQKLLMPKPRAGTLDRRAGGALHTVPELLDVTCVVDSDWKEFECIRVNGGTATQT